MERVSDWLDERFVELSAGEFYRELFPAGELEQMGEEVQGKYRGIALRIRDGKAKRYWITDGLEVLGELEKSKRDELWLASPVSYAGKANRQEMARWLYAVAIDLDGIRRGPKGELWGLENVLGHAELGIIPEPTHIVSSGTGVHLYFMLEKPVAMYRNVIKQLGRWRHEMIPKFWSSYISDLHEAPQFESVTQGFRMVGTWTKTGERVRAWRCGGKTNVDELNEYAKEPAKVVDVTYKSNFTLAEARERFPDWYQRRIVEGQPRGGWTVKRALYDWWKDQKIDEIKSGHRYFYLLCLAVYAQKCGIGYDELLTDATKALHVLKKLDKPGNELTTTDMVKALEAHNADYQTFPRKSIAAITGLRIDPNKRNHRTRSDHLKIARFVRDLNRDEGNAWWATGNRGGAPTKRELVRAWRKANPSGRKIDCERALGISRTTVLKWWDA